MKLYKTPYGVIEKNSKNPIAFSTSKQSYQRPAAVYYCTLDYWSNQHDFQLPDRPRNGDLIALLEGSQTAIARDPNKVTTKTTALLKYGS